MTLNDTYAQLIEFLDQHKAHYRLIDHPSEGRTKIVSPMRGNKTLAKPRLERIAKYSEPTPQ